MQPSIEESKYRKNQIWNLLSEKRKAPSFHFKIPGSKARRFFPQPIALPSSAHRSIQPVNFQQARHLSTQTPLVRGKPLIPHSI